MVAPRYRSRSRKKRVRRTPGGSPGIRYVNKRPAGHKCASCGALLHGVPSGLRPAGVNKLSKSKKRPERMMGGHLCAKCVRDLVKNAVRSTEEK